MCCVVSDGDLVDAATVLTLARVILLVRLSKPFHDVIVSDYFKNKQLSINVLISVVAVFRRTGSNLLRTDGALEGAIALPVAARRLLFGDSANMPIHY